MRNNNRKKLMIFAIIIALLLVASTFKNDIIFLTGSILWRLNNGSMITFHGMSLKVPLNWKIDENTDELLTMYTLSKSKDNKINMIGFEREEATRRGVYYKEHKNPAIIQEDIEVNEKYKVRSVRFLTENDSIFLKEYIYIPQFDIVMKAANPSKKMRREYLDLLGEIK
ncbi:hypothetical protein CHISP_0559 [Chitinispirillum alkaliphilum]|nr:hypothetical protein CHISP_0559 [Chitinispirillum alkaliphilum]